MRVYGAHRIAVGARDGPANIQRRERRSSAGSVAIGQDLAFVGIGRHRCGVTGTGTMGWSYRVAVNITKTYFMLSVSDMDQAVGLSSARDRRPGRTHDTPRLS